MFFLPLDTSHHIQSNGVKTKETSAANSGKSSSANLHSEASLLISLMQRKKINSGFSKAETRQLSTLENVYQDRANK